MKKLLLAALILFVVVTAVAVDWYPAIFKQGWHQRSDDFCSSDTQCLVSPSGSQEFDGMPEKFFTETKPYCINNNQFILDFYCSNGYWSSRTKLLALNLLSIANANSPSDFSLFCAPAELALNNLDYEVDNILVIEYFNDCHPHGTQDDYSCVNSVCVLKYGNNIAFGTSLNIPIDDPRSFLKALDKSENLCNSEKNNNNRFDLCSDNIWYNHDIESVIVLKTGNVPALNTNLENTFITQPFTILNNLAAGANLDFFAEQKVFNNLFFAKKGSKEVFSFLEKDKTEFSYDYLGFYSNNLNINNFCNDVIYNVDSNVVCDDSSNSLVIAKKTPEIDDSLVNLWADLTAKLRLT